MISFLMYILVGGIIGWLGQVITNVDLPGGILGNIIFGIIGAWIGGQFFGDWGLALGGVYVFPAILGSLIFIVIWVGVGRLLNR